MALEAECEPRQAALSLTAAERKDEGVWQSRRSGTEPTLIKG